MSATPAAACFQTDQPNAGEEQCDLCGSPLSSFVVAEASAENCRIVMCGQCRLMYASPRFGESALDTFYQEGFANDPGSRAKVGSSFPRDKELRKEENLAASWGMKIIQRFIEVQGKRILDLRCRSGALSAALTTQGAEVFSVDPFEANINYARQMRGLPNVVLLPFTRFHQCAEPYPFAFDAVNVLAHHVLAHVPSPRRLLTKIFAALRPGGYLFLDEKDVLRPVRYQTRSVFDSGLAHQYHLTLHTTAHYLHSVGFELVECEIDPQRVSDYHHIRAVARKPDKSVAPIEVPQFLDPEPTTGDIRRRLCWLERSWRLHRAGVVLKRKGQRLLRSISSR